ncbi:MAG: GAF domain-containing protein, partial [Thermoguttaceae bacterium]|nr:GAF domain-containing protein [Thermoguttaceae bacterium]
MTQFNIFSELDQRVEIDARPCLPSIDSMGSLPALLRSYGKILGWTFRFVPSNDNVPSILEQVAKPEKLIGNPFAEQTSKQSAPSLKIYQPSNDSVEQAAPQPDGVPVEIRLSDGKTYKAGVIEYRSVGSMWNSFEALARQAASAIADMVGETLTTRYQLWRREAELASKSALPLCQQIEEDRQLAFLLQEILHGAADALGCAAASMHLLDEKTSVLKMRSCWGLPTERFMEPARPLRTSAADLEAMLGRAVSLEDEEAMRQWNSPEDFPAGLCVPIISQSNILGTVWFYSSNARCFSKRQVQTAELIAGRLASELERDALLEVYLNQESFKKEIEAAALIQKNQAPISSPWIEKWDMAGKVKQQRGFGGNFYDWFTMPDGKIVCALSDCNDQGTTAALTASMVKSSLRSHAQYLSSVNDLVRQVDRTIWASSAADQYVNLFCAILDSKSDMVHFSASGKMKIYRVNQTSVEPLSQETPMLGQT